MSTQIKKKILKLLEEDTEFRYMVAGYLGYSEILKNIEKIWIEIKALREEQEKLWENTSKLWEGQNKLWEEVRDIKITLGRVAITIDRITISVEEEALSYIRYRLRNELGLEVSLDRLFIDTKEINIYGVVGEFCIIGETAVRLGVGLIEELIEKVKMIKSKRPNLLRPKLIKVIYTDYATPDALEYAKQNNIWVLKWSGDLTSRVIEELD